MPTLEPSGEPTMYFKVDKKHPEAEGFTGERNGELLNEGEHGYMAHLAPGFHQLEEGVGKRLSTEGNGDIVIEGLSMDGWRKVIEVFHALEVGSTGGKIADAIIKQLDWLTWDRPSNGN